MKEFYAGACIAGEAGVGVSLYEMGLFTKRACRERVLCLLRLMVGAAACGAGNSYVTE